MLLRAIVTTCFLLCKKTLSDNFDRSVKIEI